MSAETTVSESRRYKRDPFSRIAWITLVDDDGAIADCWECRTFDLSRSGLGLRSPRDATVGLRVAVEIMDGRGGRQTVLYGLIRQCRPIDHDDRLIGIEFSQIEMSRALQSHLERWQPRAA